jgi:hypothetical protein
MLRQHFLFDPQERLVFAPLLDLDSSFEPKSSISFADLFHHLIESFEMTDAFLCPLHDEDFEGLLSIGLSLEAH